MGLQYQKPVADWVLGVSAGYVDGKAQATPNGSQRIKATLTPRNTPGESKDHGLVPLLQTSPRLGTAPR